MNRITINGTTYEFPAGSNINVVNGRVTIGNGMVLQDDKATTIEIHGNVGSVLSDLNVEVKGSVSGDVKAGGNVACGPVQGSASAGGNMVCGSVGGGASAGGNMIGRR